MPLLEATGLRKHYSLKRNIIGRTTESHVAVDGVSFSLGESETLALVGESGAGKSTVGRMVLRLIEPDEGSVVYDGRDILKITSAGMRGLRSDMQMIFQDPYSSLDPKITIAGAVTEPLLLHTDLPRRQREEQAGDLLRRVGIRRDQWDRYPYELSGGQLQRVAIARAIATRPKLIVCDEPVAALDVSIRAQVLNLLRDLQAEEGIAYLFITHDLSLVRSFAHRVAVMRHGSIVEEGPADSVISSPRESYTQELVAAIPRLDPSRRSLTRRAGGDEA